MCGREHFADLGFLLSVFIEIYDIPMGILAGLLSLGPYTTTPKGLHSSFHRIVLRSFWTGHSHLLLCS